MDLEEGELVEVSPSPPKQLAPVRLAETDRNHDMSHRSSSARHRSRSRSRDKSHRRRNRSRSPSSGSSSLHSTYSSHSDRSSVRRRRRRRSRSRDHGRHHEKRRRSKPEHQMKRRRSHDRERHSSSRHGHPRTREHEDRNGRRPSSYRAHEDEVKQDKPIRLSYDEPSSPAKDAHSRVKSSKHALVEPPLASTHHHQQQQIQDVAPVDKQNRTIVKEDEEIEEDSEFHSEDEEARLIEERRKRREEILAKYQTHEKSYSSPGPDERVTPEVPMALPKEGSSTLASPVEAAPEVTEEISAADYDYVAVEKQGDDDDELKHQRAVLDKAARHPSAVIATEPLGDTEYDLFADVDDGDLFASGEPIRNADLAAETQSAGVEYAIPASLQRSHDNYDDPEGYYRLLPGELIHGRYQVTMQLGKGVFSSVVKARDLKEQAKSGSSSEVAIKIIRSNDVMYRAGQKELSLLKRLADADPEGRKHVIRYLDHFQHRGHLCIVFESMSMNLREVMKKFGGKKGLNLKAVRVYAQQLFLSLSLLHKCNIIHADLKPDNILVNEAKTILKLADLGSASDASENDITPYLVSRFYRAPEIMLGLNYDYAIDVWSVACSLFELYTGKILFPGHSNNQMLRLIMDTKGRFPIKMLKGAFADQHFENASSGSFTFYDRSQKDKVSGKELVRKVMIPVRPSRDIKSRILNDEEKRRLAGNDEEMKIISAFIDLLEKALVLNPEKRLTIKEAFAHPFITGKY